MFNSTFNNISVISWLSDLLEEEIRVIMLCTYVGVSSVKIKRSTIDQFSYIKEVGFIGEGNWTIQRRP